MLSRRKFLGASCAICSGLTTLGQAAETQVQLPSRRNGDGESVLAELMAGNGRFADGKAKTPRRMPTDFRMLSGGQRPEAVIVGCADSRVPPEVLFDEGVGDLFVVRVAGNVVNGAGAIVKGSIEYAVAELEVPLIVVLGHSQCGAVKAAIADLDQKAPLPGAIGGLVELIRPAVERVRSVEGNVLENAIVANVQLGVERLKTIEPILAPAVRENRLTIVGAIYDLASGRVRLVS